MVVMDFKGITWVGNVYQKFEAMCLEVEEAVCQDTVKFVENQAQTVGASVKKFYSDVMQDLLPPSSIDPVKVAAADLPLNPYADFGIHKKLKTSIKKDTIKTDKQVTEDSKVTAGLNTNYRSSLYSIGPIKGSGLEQCLERNEHLGLYKRKSRRYNNMPSELSRSISPLSKDLSRVSSSRQIGENHEAARGQIAMISCSAAGDGTGRDSSGAKSHKTVSGSATVSAVDSSIDMQIPNMSLPVESDVNNETKFRCTYSNGEPDVLAAELNGTCTKSGVVSPIGSCTSGDPQDNESASEDCLAPTGDFNLDVNENGDVIIKPGMQAIDKQLDTSKLEETCVLVDTELVRLVAHRKDKARSYKKKIQKAFSSKMSARKQEYEQLAVQHGDIEARSNQESAESLMLTFSMDAGTNKSPTQGDSESEWELL